MTGYSSGNDSELYVVEWADRPVWTIVQHIGYGGRARAERQCEAFREGMPHKLVRMRQMNAAECRAWLAIVERGR